MRILITGCKGQLGSELMALAAVIPKVEAIGVDIDSLDLTDSSEVEAFLRRERFTHVVNCAAYTAVDRAEEQKAQCAAANIAAVENIARLADELDFRILHISTDYIFDGMACRPYDESAKPNPLNVYGSTKRRGETALLGLAPESVIIRTGWLYSAGNNNFVHTILERGRQDKRLEVVVDQTGTPTYAADLAQAVMSVLTAPAWMPGIYNYSNEGIASWYDFAVAILETAGMHRQAEAVVPVSSADYTTPAVRPAYTVLDKSKIKATFGISIPHWQASLRKCIAAINII